MSGVLKGYRSVLAAAIVVVGSGAGLVQALPSSDYPLEHPVVFLQLPVTASRGLSGRAGGMLRADYGDGGRIVRLEPDGRLRVLTEQFAGAGELDVSFDADRILFAAKRRQGDPWDIWEMNADGTGKRQVTRDHGNCRQPAYQSTLYTIVSTEPWFQVMFASDAAGALNEWGSGAAMSLYSCRLDGTSMRRLTANLSDDLDPFLMNDGRVLHAGGQRADLRRGFWGRISLFGVNTDGADYALFCGDQGRRIKHMPCATEDGLVVFVEADRVGWDGAGQLAAVSVRRNHHSYRSLTNDVSLLYHSPTPLPGGSIVVSRRPADASETHGLWEFDPRTGGSHLLFDDPVYHDIHAKVLTPRCQPDGRSSVVNEKYPTGQLYCLNANLTDPSAAPRMPAGTTRTLRVIEGVPARAGERISDSLQMWPPVVRMRLLGVAPIEEDGSFQIEIPADLPVQLQTLDADGLALASSGWIWVKHREPRGCIGCHEDPELTPENRLVAALRRPATRLTLPALKRRTVDFRRDVMPIIERKCMGCHGDSAREFDLELKPTGGADQVYAALLEGVEDSVAGSDPVRGKYIHPGQARTSPLVWRLFGRNTVSSEDAAMGSGQAVSQCPPAEAKQLFNAERATLVEWVDLGAHWSGIPEPVGPATDAGLGRGVTE